MSVSSRLPLFLPLALTFVLFAILLNSVGPVILQSMLTFGVSKTQASILEGCKDLSIAAASFVVASFLPQLGYRRGAALGLLAVAAACAAVPFVESFWFLALQYVIVGIAFAIAKTAIYVIIGLVSSDSRSHASTTSVLEGIFMLGVLSSFWLISAFIDPANPASPRWLEVYWLLAGAAAVVAWLVWRMPLDEASAKSDDMRAFPEMLRLLALPFVAAFVACSFLNVLVDQSINSWLPTFNSEVLALPPVIAVQLASLYATGIAVGRLGAGLLLRYVPWHRVLIGGLVGAGLLLAVAIPNTHPVMLGDKAGWADLPAVAFAVPFVGFLLAPIYPVLCSTVLTAVPSSRHTPMTGLILIFSAIGGTLGSLATGRIFAALDGKIAFLAILGPMVLLVVTIILFHRALRRANPAG